MGTGIDLRSDTVTRPDAGMRRAMAGAEVGDDVLDGDPTTGQLEARLAEMLELDAALFFPSGVQANQVAMWMLAPRGTEVLLEADAHIIHYEMAALAGLAGAQPRPVATPDGVLTASLATAAMRPDTWYYPTVSVLAAENTHNAAGGKVMPAAVWDGLVAHARQHDLAMHLDGARLWNAATALGLPPARLVRGATTVAVSLSKGLGCPVGSCLLGDRSLMEEARRCRRRFGGAMRQTGILAAAGLYALEHNVARLTEDHENARLLAKRLSGHDAVRPVEPETNIVMLDLCGADANADHVVRRLSERGVQLVAFGPRRLRAVTHLGVSRQDVDRAAAVIAGVASP